MSFTATGLRDSVLGKLNALSDEDLLDGLALHTAWADGLSEYIIDELLANGSYVGVTNTVPPVADPLSGSYDWAVTSMTLTGSQLKGAVWGVGTDPFSKWVTAIETGIKTIVFNGADSSGSVTTSTGLLFTPFVLTLTQNDIVNVLERDLIIEVITAKIYDSVVATIVSGLSSPATSSTPGTGVVSYVNVH